MESLGGSDNSFENEFKAEKDGHEEPDEFKPKLHPNQGLNAEQGAVPDHSEEETRLLIEYLVPAKQQLVAILAGEKVKNPDDLDQEQVKKPKKAKDADARSISTGASLDGVFQNRKNSPTPAFSKANFKCEESETFCRNIAKRFNQWKKEIKESGSRVNATVLHFLAQCMIHHMVEPAEVDIFFDVFADLVDPNSDKVYLTETAFSRLFYDLLLRFNFEFATESIYLCLERCVLFLNKHLGNIQLTPFGGFKIIENKKLIGADAIIQMHLYAKQPSVKEMSHKFLYQLFTAELDRGQGVDQVVMQDFIQPCQDVITQGHENLASDANGIQVIMSGVDLMTQVLKHVFGDTSGGPNQQERSMKARQVSSRANGTLIKVVVENNTSVQKHKNIDISISLFDTVRSLKSQILDLFGTFAANDIFFMSKGRMLYELDKSLKEHGVGEGQKILLFMNEEDVPAEEFMLSKKEQRIQDIREVLPEVKVEVISYALTNNGDDVPMAISQLSDGGSYFVEEELTDIEKKKRELSQANQQGGMSEMDVAKLQASLSESEGLYQLIFRLMKLEHHQLKSNLWDLLKLLPLMKSAKQEIENQTKGEQQEDFGFLERLPEGRESNSHRKSWKVNLEEMMGTLSCETTCYQLYVLANIIRESSHDFLHEWLLMEGTLANFGLIFQGRSFLISRASKMDVEFVQAGSERPLAADLDPVDDFCKHYGRFFCNLSTVIKEMNKRYLSPPSLKIPIPITEHIAPFLLRELDLVKEFDPTSGAPHEFYAEMYSQILEENQFIKELDQLAQRLLDNYKQVHITYRDIYLDTVVSVFSILLDYLSATKNVERINQITQRLISSTVESATAGNMPIAMLFMNICSYYLCLNNLEMAALDWLNQKFSNPPKGTNPSEYKMAISVASAFLDILDRKITKVHGQAERAEQLLVDMVISLGKIFRQIVDGDSLSQLLVEDAVGFLNEIAGFLRAVLRSLKTVNPEFQKLKVVSDFKTEVVEYSLYLIFMEPESSFTHIAVDQQCKLRLNFYDILCQCYDKSWKDSLEFLNKVRILYQEPDFKGSSLNYVDYRRNSSYIGIRNLGSTCYANSLLQQFFHNRRIREFIHKLPININEPMDSMSGNGVLRELMLLFGQLALNKSSQADLTNFTCKFTGFDGMPINVKVQQDVNEFFNLLLDCLERELAALDLPNSEDAFKCELGGTFLNEITSADPAYDYSTSNEEHFNTITIDVKNVHTMQNGLEKFFHPTIFDGDNKLHVDKYQTKIVAKKNTWLSKDLPKTLVVMLKRFEYDMRNYTRYKLNDYFEFPLELNLQKYVKTGTVTEGIDVLGDGVFYSYKLKGVLVHSGSSEFGHYYSYICVNGKWMEFNDTKVADFDPTPDNIRREWFGGESEDAKNFVSAGRQSSKSAYILFYERIHRNGELSYSSEGEQNNPLDVQLIKPEVQALIEAENKNFVRKKVFSDGVTLRFLNEMLDRLDNDEGIEALANMLIQKDGEEVSIKDHELYAFLQHTRSIVLNKLGSRYEILKPLANALNEMGRNVQAVFLEEYVPSDGVLNKIINDSGPNSRQGMVAYGAGMCFESFHNSQKANKGGGHGADSADALASPPPEGVIPPKVEKLSEVDYELIQQLIDQQPGQTGETKAESRQD